MIPPTQPAAPEPVPTPRTKVLLEKIYARLNSITLEECSVKFVGRELNEAIDQLKEHALMLERELNAAKAQPASCETAGKSNVEVAAQAPVPDAGVRSDIAEKIECLCGYLTAIMKGKYRFSYEEIPAVVQEASEFAEQLRGENRFPESPLSEKTGQLRIEAPTPATSEDTRLLDWLLAYRCTVARYDSGPNWGSAYTQHFLDRQALRAAMAHAGEQKT